MKRPILFFEKCSCNPSNGGSGMCGCTIANKIVGYEEDEKTFRPRNNLESYKYCPHCGKDIK